MNKMNILTKQAAQLPEKCTNKCASLSHDGCCYVRRKAIDDCTTALPNVNKVLIEEIKSAECMRMSPFRDMKSTNQNALRREILAYLETLTKDV